ncbi:nematocyst expressed protein 3-like, partial [Lucilia cuprina]|uniref:nematocyst expressed protein 3-like n=1 Tax=Lucilia cuprina TaxID=7375 RepID=UPI001F064071
SASYSAPAASYSAPAASYSAPAASYSAPVASYSAPAASYSAPAASYSAPAASFSSYETAASAPAHSFSSAEGYRYKTAKRRVIRRRRFKFFIVLCALVAAATADVSHLSNKYLPPHQQAASAPAVSYSPAPAAQSFHVEAASAPAVSYSAPAPAAQSFHVEAASAPAVSYSAPAAQTFQAASAPAASYETASFETAAAEPAHTFSSDEGYRYKTVKRRVIRRRRDVSTEYLPPVAASAPVAQYESAPVETYAAPAASYESYEVAAAEPAHSFSSADGYRYRTSKRRVIRRRRRDVSTEYLPPVAASAPVAQYESAPIM